MIATSHSRLIYPLLRFFRIEAAFFRNCLTRDLQYRGNFLLVFLMDVIWYSVHLGFFQVIYFNTDSIAGYTKADVFFFMATTFVIDAIDMTFFASSLWMLNELVRKGDFDMILSKPVSPLMYASMRYISLGSLLDLFFAIGLLVFAFINLGASPTVLDVAAYLFLMACGLAVMYSMQLFFASIGFIFVSASTGLQMGFHHLYQLAMKPEAIYKGVVRFLLLYFLPMIAISALPSLVVLRGFQWEVFLVGAAVASACLFGAIIFFYFALRRYESASS